VEIPLFSHSSYQPGDLNSGASIMDANASMLRGFTGVVAPILAIVTSFQTELEWWLRVTALVAGILVSLLSIVSLLKNLRK
jgi:hypothetical protein